VLLNYLLTVTLNCYHWRHDDYGMKGYLTALICYEIALKSTMMTIFACG